jgi:hypothetical protein
MGQAGDEGSRLSPADHPGPRVDWVSQRFDSCCITSSSSRRRRSPRAPSWRASNWSASSRDNAVAYERGTLLLPQSPLRADYLARRPEYDSARRRTRKAPPARGASWMASSNVRPPPIVLVNELDAGRFGWPNRSPAKPLIFFRLTALASFGQNGIWVTSMFLFLSLQI